MANAEGLVDSSDDLYKQAEDLNHSVRVLNKIVGGVKRKEAGFSNNDDIQGHAMPDQEQAVAFRKKNALPGALPNMTA